MLKNILQRQTSTHYCLKLFILVCKKKIKGYDQISRSFFVPDVTKKTTSIHLFNLYLTVQYHKIDAVHVPTRMRCA